MRVALTGHRPQRLGLPEDETDEKWIPIQHWIIDELSNFIKTCRDNNELLDLYTGMASGSDIAFAITGVSMNYINSIKLHCILPCKNYNSSHKYYKFLKLKASEWVELSDEFYKVQLINVNSKMRKNLFYFLTKKGRTFPLVKISFFERY